MKSRKSIPKSPSCRSASELEKRPRPNGPIAQPSARKRSTGVTPSTRESGAMSTDAARNVKMSPPKASSSPLLAAAEIMAVGKSRSGWGPVKELVDRSRSWW